MKIRLIDFCIKGLKIPRVIHGEDLCDMQAFPRVTHGEDLCKTRHELLMGRFYAKLICIICRESACILDITWGGFMLLEGNPVINHVLHKTSPCIIPNHSTIVGGIYAKVTLGMYPLIESERS